jgi:glycosyltransferase involved in cell wall biosynthesis
LTASSFRRILVPRLELCWPRAEDAMMQESTTESRPGRAQTLALAIADINWFTTENLFRELDEPSVSVLALRCMDYVNGWHKGIYPWSRSTKERSWGRNSLVRDFVLPSGWMKRFPRLGMRPIASAVRSFWGSGDLQSRRGLVLTYPHYLYLREQLDPDVTLYYNIDDYSLYWPRHAAKIRMLEREMVLRADATICVARRRAEELRAALPQAATRIHHLPHGTAGVFLAETPDAKPARAPREIAHLSRPLLGYVGSIGPRIDWPLLKRLSEELPEATIVVAGAQPAAGKRREPWFQDWSEFSARPNVHTLGWLPQAALPHFFRAFDVILIPYAQNNCFNLACSPTKIMDGLGSGRPIVATAIPECLLYSDLFDVAADADAFVAAVRLVLAKDSDDGKAGARHAHARQHTCRLVAGRLLATIGRCR